MVERAVKCARQIHSAAVKEGDATVMVVLLTSRSQKTAVVMMMPTVNVVFSKYLFMYLFFLVRYICSPICSCLHCLLCLLRHVWSLYHCHPSNGYSLFVLISSRILNKILNIYIPKFAFFHVFHNVFNVLTDINHRKAYGSQTVLPCLHHYFVYQSLAFLFLLEVCLHSDCF